MLRRLWVQVVRWRHQMSQWLHTDGVVVVDYNVDGGLMVVAMMMQGTKQCYARYVANSLVKSSHTPATTTTDGWKTVRPY